MYNPSEAYKRAMRNQLRQRGYMTVSLGLINQIAQDTASVDGQFLWFSKTSSLFNNKETSGTYATLEQNFMKADGSQYFMPDSAEDNYLQYSCLISENIGGSINIVFPKVEEIRGFTFSFDENCYPTQFSLSSDGNFSKVYNNTTMDWSTTDYIGNATTLTITPITMVGGEQRLRISKIKIGVGLNFNNSDISDFNFDTHTSFLSADLSHDEFSLTILDPDKNFEVEDETSFASFLETGQKMSVSCGIDIGNGGVEYLPLCNLSLSEWCVKDSVVTFKASDDFSFMTNKYSGSNYIHTRTLYDDAVAILTDAGYDADEYDLDLCLNDIEVTNPLPEGTHAECLQLIASAARCILFQDRAGKIVIKANFSTVIDPADIDLSANEQTSWSNVNNILEGDVEQYGDMSYNSTNAISSTYFLPEGTNYIRTGFVSYEIADDNGAFINNPEITLHMPAVFSYYGLTLQFGDVVPTAFNIKTYRENTLIDTFSYTGSDIEKEKTYLENFLNFDTLKVQITGTQPNARVLINRVTFGDSTDYFLSKDLIIDKPTAFKEQRTKNVLVKIYTFLNDNDGGYYEVENNIFCMKSLNDSGETRYFENPLISNQSWANDVADWVANYYKNNISYSCDYRGEPRLDSGDIIRMENDVISGLQVYIETAKLSFNGAFGGSLDLRRNQAFEPIQGELVNIPNRESSLVNRVNYIEENYLPSKDNNYIDNLFPINWDNPPTYDRPQSANIGWGDGALRQFKATGQMTEGKPNCDGNILHFAWDNKSGAPEGETSTLDAELFVPNQANMDSSSGAHHYLGFRGQNHGTWEDWVYCARDDEVLHLNGGAITGRIARNRGGDWISDRDNVAVFGASHGQPLGNTYNPVVGQKTNNGAWTIGNLSGHETLFFNYTTDDNYATQQNVRKTTILPVPSGNEATLITTDNIPSYATSAFYQSDHNVSTYSKALIETSITVANNQPYMAEIKVYGYTAHSPIYCLIHGYNYNNDLYPSGCGITWVGSFTPTASARPQIVRLNNGKMGILFPMGWYWQYVEANVWIALKGVTKTNLVTNITYGNSFSYANIISPSVCYPTLNYLP